ncbi:MAG: hypothetical protein U9N83_07140 [Thermodesulfobacteriota bacterium]|nr:hypothetical protein [Thermodesulfobacteriota bacterium]
MLHDILSRYLESIEAVVRNLKDAYVNTPHFSDLESFPHHKHLSNDVVSSYEPSVIRAIEEAIRLAE